MLFRSMLVQPALAGRAIDIDYGVDYVRLNVMTDSDGDGVADVSDACPLDPAKTAPGQCGCGTADCNEVCVDDPSKFFKNTVPDPSGIQRHSDSGRSPAGSSPIGGSLLPTRDTPLVFRQPVSVLSPCGKGGSCLFFPACESTGWSPGERRRHRKAWPPDGQTCAAQR